MRERVACGVKTLGADFVKLICVAVLTLLMFVAIPGHAQESGTILGIVKDASGGVVPDTKVTILNTETGDARTVTTDTEGSYRVPALQVGHYTVKIEKEGFKTQTATGLSLSVTQELVVNASLEVGASTQEVQVSAEAIAQVETTNSSLGTLVSEQSVAELPLNGRNWIDLTLMQPGVTRGVAGGANNTGTAFSSNGAPIRANNTMLDGAIMQNIFGVNSSSVSGSTLGVDGIREFKVITSMFGAEYGMSMGSQTTIVSKGGSNQFHGDLFEYIRNSVLDARNFFELQPSSVQLNGKRLPEYKRNQFGGSFGGPIQKDKTFFYAVFEALRERKGLTPAQGFVPALGCRAPAGTHLTNAMCPQLNLPASTPYVVVGQFTPLLMSPIPLPNGPNNALYTAFTQPTTEQYGQIRVDHNFSASDNAFVRYTIDDALQNPLLAYGPPEFVDTLTNRSQFLSIGENHIFSPQLINSARLSFSRTTPATTASDNTGISFVGGGIPGIGIGIVSITSFKGYGPPSAYPDTNKQDIFTLSDDAFWTKGRHALKFGVLANRYRDWTNDGHYISGNYAFGSLPLFEAGLIQTYTAMAAQGTTTPFGTPNPISNWVFYTAGFYAQDDIRVSSRLTVNAGLRYEFNTVPRESSGLEYSVRNITVDKAPTHGPIMDNTSYLNFSPRVGFAWDTFGNGKMSVRGGFGIYYDIANFGTLLFQHALGTPPTSTVTQDTPLTCKLPIPGTPLPTDCTEKVAIPFVFPAGTFGNSMQTSGYHNPQATMYQYNLSVERQLPADILLSVGFVSNRGHNLWRATQENARYPTSFVNGRPYWTVLPANTPNPNLFRVNPAWGPAVVATSENYYGAGGSQSWYNGLQAVLTKRVSHGLQFQTSYTYAKTIDTTQGQMAGGDGTTDTTYPFDNRFDRGPTGFSVTHNFQFNSVYHFPNMKSDRWVSKLSNGWWMGNILAIQTGFPFTPLLTYQPSGSLAFGTALAQDRPDYVTADNLAYAKTLNANAVVYDRNAVIVGTANTWYNPNMFVPAKPDPVLGGTIGNVSRGILPGPGLTSWNLSLSKNTPIQRLGEQGNLQFRAEFFNVMNHPVLGAPSTSAFGPAGVITTPQITATAITARQIQFSLRLEF